MDTIELGVDIARRAGLEKEHVLNTMLLGDVKKMEEAKVDRRIVNYLYNI